MLLPIPINLRSLMPMPVHCSSIHRTPIHSSPIRHTPIRRTPIRRTSIHTLPHLPPYPFECIKPSLTCRHRHRLHSLHFLTSSALRCHPRPLQVAADEEADKEPRQGCEIQDVKPDGERLPARVDATDRLVFRAVCRCGVCRRLRPWSINTNVFG